MSGEDRGDLVAVGSVTSVHGVRGELAVLPLTDFPERLAPGATVLLESPGGALSTRRILGARPHKGRVLISLEGVADRSAAEALRGGRLCIREADLPQLEDGAAWLHELAGMAVSTESGDDLGRVHGLLDTGGGRLVLVVRGPRGEVLLPYVDHFVLDVDRGARRLTVRLIEGMLD